MLSFSCRCDHFPANITDKTITLFIIYNSFSSWHHFCLHPVWFHNSIFVKISFMVWYWNGVHRKRNKIGFISSVWDDDCIQRLVENNWQCLWWIKTFQGINANKALAHAMKKGYAYWKLICSHGKIPSNKIPRASSFQNSLEGCCSGLFWKYQSFHFKFT